MNKKIKALRQKKIDLKNKADQILASASDREFTAEERTSLDTIKAELAQAETDIATVEALLANSPAAGDGARADADEKDKLPFATLGEQLVAVVNASRGRVDPRLLAAASGASEAVPADGGFLVQKDYTSNLLTRSYETGILTSKCSRIPISANANGTKINAIDETSRATGSRWGGVQVYWASEADTVTAKKPKFRKIELELKKLMGLCYATDEMLQDSTALEATINKAFPEEFGFVLDGAILDGTGAGQPLGVNNTAALVAVAKEAAQAADSVVAANVLKMFARMPARLIPGAEWYLNQDVLPQLPQMVIGTQPVYLPPTGLTGASPFGTLLGRPVNVIEQAATVGDQGDIMFANFGEYVMIDKGGLNAQQSLHVRFIYDEMTFKWTYRVDGQPAWNAPLTPYKGANSLSPFVVLADRA